MFFHILPPLFCYVAKPLSSSSSFFAFFVARYVGDERREISEYWTNEGKVGFAIGAAALLHLKGEEEKEERLHSKEPERSCKQMPAGIARRRPK